MDIGYRVELQADSMPGATEVMVFTVSYKHMQCMGGMRLQSFLTLFTHATSGTPASLWRHLLEKLDDRIFLRFFFSTVGGGIKKNTIILTKARME